MRPQRVQLSRTKGWRMPPNTVKVSRPTKWGNPFKAGTYWFGHPITPRVAVDAYRQRLSGELMRAASEELRGKNLACWCALDQPCHADVLLEIANREEP